MKVAILGYGTVGSGVFDVLTENRDIIAKRVGFPLDVKYVLDLREFPGKPVEKYLTHDFRQIIEDPEIDIVVEVMGGIH
ncbi:MAG: homoserine dehydrogenase, partial [Lachnospiraceae bacterium]|nr:homoserine dehydrogenase [Lachnospiraceae bacterium]